MKTELRRLSVAETEQLIFADHRATILGECLSAHRSWRGDTLCEVSDVVQEVHIYLWVRRDRILHATDRRGLIRRMVKDATSRFFRRQHRQLRYPETLASGTYNERREAPDMP